MLQLQLKMAAELKSILFIEPKITFTLAQWVLQLQHPLSLDWILESSEEKLALCKKRNLLAGRKNKMEET